MEHLEKQHLGDSPWCCLPQSFSHPARARSSNHEQQFLELLARRALCPTNTLNLNLRCWRKVGKSGMGGRDHSNGSSHVVLLPCRCGALRRWRQRGDLARRATEQWFLRILFLAADPSTTVAKHGFGPFSSNEAVAPRPGGCISQRCGSRPLEEGSIFLPGSCARFNVNRDRAGAARGTRQSVQAVFHFTRTPKLTACGVGLHARASTVRPAPPFPDLVHWAHRNEGRPKGGRILEAGIGRKSGTGTQAARPCE